MDPPSAPDVSRDARRRQDVVVDLGRLALEADELDAVLEEAMGAVAETLEAEYCCVLEALPEGDEYLVRAGAGWDDGVVGSTTVPVAVDGLTAEPAVAGNGTAGAAVGGADLFETHGVEGGFVVTVGRDEEPWGLLGAFTADPRSFTEHERGFLRAVANVLASRVQTERAAVHRDEIYGRISDGFFALDEEWRFTYLNERAHELINPEGRTLVGADVWEEFPDAIGRSFKPKYERAMYEQETVSFEEYYPDPLDAWFEVRAYPSESGLSVYFRDVTERKEYERRLERSEQRYRALAEHFPSGAVTLFDADLRYTLAAGQGFEAFDFSASDVEGRTVREVWGDDVADALEPVLEATLAGEKTVTEVEWSDRRWRIHGVPITDTSDDVFAGMTMALDVTDQRERERELRERKTQLEAATAAGAVGTFEWHVQEDRFVTGPQLAAKFGVDPEAAREGVPLDRFVSAIHEDDVDRVEAAVDGALEACGEYEAEYRVWDADDELRWVAARGAVECEDGEPVSFPGTVTDVTERKRYERRLEESNERLEQFAYAASHDLQEPLRMVSSYLQLIERRYADEFDEDGEEFLAFAVDGADRMRNMIDGLLRYSRVETQGEALEPVDLDGVLADVREDLAVKVEETDAEITAESLPTVHGDSRQLRQVFQNLLDNAMEYSGEEPPRVHVTSEPQGSRVVVSVRDEGIGIDPDHADRIFEVFQSLHGPDEHEGTGIGLALCERIVERHGGAIWVDSEPGEGATISFTLASVGTGHE